MSDIVIERRRPDLLGSLRPSPEIRARLHTICALYAHTNSPKDRLAILDNLEDMALETASILAEELLECGWRPSGFRPEREVMDERHWRGLGRPARR